MTDNITQILSKDTLEEVQEKLVGMTVYVPKKSKRKRARTLYCIKGYSIKRIATLLGVSHNHVYKLIKKKK